MRKLCTNTWPALPDIKDVNWKKLWVGGARGDGRWGREMLRVEDNHRTENRNEKRTDGRRLITREWGRDIILGWGWGVMRTKWNGVDFTHRENARSQIGTRLLS